MRNSRVAVVGSGTVFGLDSSYRRRRDSFSVCQPSGPSAPRPSPSSCPLQRLPSPSPRRGDNHGTGCHRPLPPLLGSRPISFLPFPSPEKVLGKRGSAPFFPWSKLLFVLLGRDAPRLAQLSLSSLYTKKCASDKGNLIENSTELAVSSIGDSSSFFFFFLELQIQREKRSRSGAIVESVQAASPSTTTNDEATLDEAHSGESPLPPSLGKPRIRFSTSSWLSVWYVFVSSSSLRESVAY